MNSKNFHWPILGCGAGLRSDHYSFILSEKPKISWFEAISENFMDSGGRPLEILTQVRQNYPVALHGVSLSIGSADPLNKIYLQRLKKLADRIEPFVVSDHLCWSGVEGESLHDLLPLAMTEEAVDYVARRIQQVQETLGRKILIENVSTYVTYKHSTLPEWEFLTETARRAGCGILLDLNNIYVNARNHGFNPLTYIQKVPAELVGQFHLAGNTDKGEYLFDTHSGQVGDPVWKLYQKALELYGPVSTLVEWDAEIPVFEKLLAEVAKAQTIYQCFVDQPKPPLTFSPRKYPVEMIEKNRSSLLADQKKMKVLVCPKGSSAEESPFLNPQGSVSGQERMQVYAEGYTARILETLSETCVAVKHILGEAAFLQIAQGYARQYPSQSYNLTDAGRKLPDYFEETDWKDRFPFLPDLARLECLVMDSFHEFPEDSFDPACLAGLDEGGWDKLYLNFQPFVKILKSSWPILSLWEARSTPLKDLHVRLEGRPQSVLVYRRASEVFCKEITSAQYEMLSGLLSGKNLGEVCGELEKISEEELPLLEWFSFWSSQGLLARGPQ